MQLPKPVEDILLQIMQSGGQAYLVGGALRDRMLGRTASDYDIATSLPPEKITEIFPRGKTYLTGKRFGTVTVVMGGLSVEVTTFRKESGYSDSRHPDEVAFVSDLESDLSRRDFTINAMAYNPFTGSGLIDPFHGAEDSKKRVIRAVGAPRERFREDPLRMLRGIRLAAQLDFELEEDTEKAIPECRDWLHRVSGERLREELLRLLLSPRPDKGLLMLQEAEILFIVLPAGGGGTAADTTIATLTEKETQILKGVPADPDIRLAVTLSRLFPSAGEESLRNTLQNLRPAKKFRTHVLKLITGYSRFCAMELTPYAMRKLAGTMHFPDMERILDWYGAEGNVYGNTEMMRKHAEASRLVDAIVTNGDPVFPSDLTIDGVDIRSAGIGGENGRQIGEALRLAYEWVLEDPEKNDRSFLLKRLKEHYDVPQ